MLESTRLRDVKRATETLKGVLAGIACDYELSDAEIGRLYDWLHVHAHLLNLEPFSSAKRVIEDALADSVITDDEREDLLDFCHRWTDFECDASDLRTVATQRLHGFLDGISSDGKITDNEIRDLQDWLHCFEDLHELWPICHVVTLVRRTLADRQVSDAELREMLEFCNDFRSELPIEKSPEQFDPRTERHMFSNAPVLRTLTSILDTDKQIEFMGRLFCFTGQARYGKRKDLEAIVIEVGGRTHPRVIAELNYLVVGALSQPCWTYEVYGRKIEKVMDYRNRGSAIAIVHEDAFLTALQSLPRANL